MSSLDYVFIGIIGVSVLVSLFRGLIREVLSLLIWIGAFWVAHRFVDIGANSLTEFIEVPSARHLIAFVALFIATLIVGGMVNFIVGKLIKNTGLSGTDRFFGMFFGALRGVIAIVVITFFIKATPLTEDQWWQSSQLAPHFSKISEWVRQKMPEEFSEYFSFVNQESEAQVEEMIKDVLTDNTDKNQDQSEEEQ